MIFPSITKHQSSNYKELSKPQHNLNPSSSKWKAIKLTGWQSVKKHLSNIWGKFFLLSMSPNFFKILYG